VREGSWDYLYEPDAKTVLDELLVRYLETFVYQAAADNIASEQSARMVAMKSASDNALNIIEELQLIYNKSRQASITRNSRRSWAAQRRSSRGHASRQRKQIQDKTMSQAHGTIVQTIGAVIDIEFPRDAMPKIYDALVLEDSDNKLAEKGLTFEVEQQLGDGVVRTIALAPPTDCSAA